MFTGLVEDVGTVESLTRQANGITRLKVRAPKVLEDAKLGDSIAVNGCCLTAIHLEADSASFDLLDETLKRTSFVGIREGSLLNLERSLQAGARLGGHFVAGHVDATGKVENVEQVGADVELTIATPPEFMRYLVYKGSIAVDGVSLTVARLDDSRNTFTVCLIPHTLQATNLSARKAGDVVNLEFDMLAKYVERMLESSRGAGVEGRAR